MCLIPLLTQNSSKSCGENCGPLSLTISYGSPKLAINTLSASTVVFLVADCMGIVSIHLEWLSTITKTCRLSILAKSI